MRLKVLEVGYALRDGVGSGDALIDFDMEVGWRLRDGVGGWMGAQRWCWGWGGYRGGVGGEVDGQIWCWRWGGAQGLICTSPKGYDRRAVTDASGLEGL